jgi:dihydroxyacid dehydratase/phosphogluconate dehydratase
MSRDLSRYVAPEIEQVLLDQTCEACKMAAVRNYSDCPATCSAAQMAFAMEILGLSEYWDGLTPAEARKSIPIKDFVIKLAWDKIEMEKNQ